MSNVLDKFDYALLSEVIINDLYETRYSELFSCPSSRSDEYETFIDGLLRSGPEPYPELVRENVFEHLKYNKNIAQGTRLRFNTGAELNLRSLDEVTPQDQQLILDHKEFVVSAHYGSLVKLKVFGDKTRELKMQRFYHASRFLTSKNSEKDMTFSGRKIAHTIINSQVNSTNFKPKDVVYNIYTKETAMVEAISYESTPNILIARKWDGIAKKFEDKLMEFPVTYYRSGLNQISAEFDSNPGIVFSIGQKVRIKLSCLRDALVWAGMDINHLNFDIMKQIIAGDARIVDILRDKKERRQIVIKFDVTAGISAANMIDHLFPVQPEHLECANGYPYEYRSGQQTLPQIPQSYSGHRSYSGYDYQKEEEMKRKERERIRKEMEDTDRASGPYNLDKYAGKIIKVIKVESPNLQASLEGKLGVVTKIDNELGRISVDIFNHKVKTEYVFRASVGNLNDEHIAIISDVICESIDGSRHAAKV